MNANLHDFEKYKETVSMIKLIYENQKINTMYSTVLSISSNNFITSSLKEISARMPNILLVQTINCQYNEGDCITLNLAIILSYIFSDIMTKALSLDIPDIADDLYDNSSNLLTHPKNPTPDLNSDEDVNIFLEINKLRLPFEIKNWLLNVVLIFLNNTGNTNKNKKILIQLLNYFVIRKKYSNFRDFKLQSVGIRNRYVILFEKTLYKNEFITTTNEFACGTQLFRIFITPFLFDIIENEETTIYYEYFVISNSIHCINITPYQITLYI